MIELNYSVQVAGVYIFEVQRSCHVGKADILSPKLEANNGVNNWISALEPFTVLGKIHLGKPWPEIILASLKRFSAVRGALYVADIYWHVHVFFRLSVDPSLNRFKKIRSLPPL